MPSLSLIAAKKPSVSTETHFGKCRKGFRFVAEMVDVARRLWPQKTAVNLGGRAGVSQRAAEHWLACKHEMSIDAVRALIQSDEGFEFLKVLMGDSKALWWRDFRSLKARADLGREMDDLRKRQQSFFVSEERSN